MKNRKTRSAMRRMLFTLALVLVVAVASVGGTIAWLTATTEPVVNTFTYGNINIDLTETKPVNRQAKIIPGVDIEKDPKVTVKGGSEACWLFVKVEETGTFVANKVTYEVDTTANTGWTKLTGVNGVDNVWYREVGAVTADTDFNILKDNKVTVSNTLTKEDIKNITNPTLKFTAYAIQKEGSADAAAAWAKLNPTPGT